MTSMPLTGLGAPQLARVLFDDALTHGRLAEPPWRTYQWAYRYAAPGMSPLMELRLRACIERELLAGGLQRRDPPHLTIAFALGQPRKTGADAPSRARGPSAGALVIDICDARTLRRMWRGVAARPLDPQGASQAAIRAAVRSALHGSPLKEDEPRTPNVFAALAPRLLS